MTSELCSFQLCRAGSSSFLPVGRDDSHLSHGKCQMLEHAACKRYDFNTLKKSIYGYFKVELTFLCSVKLELRDLIWINNLFQHSLKMFYF